MRQRIALACQRAGRDPNSVTLIAASKTRSREEIEAAYDAGVRDFGENYLQEALPKITGTQVTQINWHFIGRLQSNKTRTVAAHFQWVHTVDRGKLLERLDAQRDGEPLNVCLQVNIDEDPAKAGFPPKLEILQTALAQAANFEHLRLRGLMTLPMREESAEESFGRLAGLHEAVADQHHCPQDWDTLSMGMSGDLEQAIAAGATHVRIGTALFGPRPPKAS